MFVSLFARLEWEFRGSYLVPKPETFLVQYSKIVGLIR
jgi:hypothetical protein